MKILEKKIVVKLDNEERESLVNTIFLLESMDKELRRVCEDCPFRDACDARSCTDCFLDLVVRDLKYINNNCD